MSHSHANKGWTTGEAFQGQCFLRERRVSVDVDCDLFNFQDLLSCRKAYIYYITSYTYRECHVYIKFHVYSILWNYSKVFIKPKVKAHRKNNYVTLYTMKPIFPEMVIRLWKYFSVELYLLISQDFCCGRYDMICLRLILSFFIGLPEISFQPDTTTLSKWTLSLW